MSTATEVREPRVLSSSNGTTHGYYVEVRNGSPGGVGNSVYNGIVIAQEWERLPFAPSKDGAGIPNRIWCPFAEHAHMLTYEAACAAMAWTAADMRNFCVEFRLVRVVVEYTSRVEELGVGEPVSFRGRERAETFTPRTPKADA